MARRGEHHGSPPLPSNAQHRSSTTRLGFRTSYPVLNARAACWVGPRPQARLARGGSLGSQWSVQKARASPVATPRPQPRGKVGVKRISVPDREA
jgi:hypothetical protein